MSAATHVLRCAMCGAPVGFQSEFCAYCRAPQAWPVVPDVQRGEPLARLEFPRDPLPADALAKGAATAVQDGVRVHVEADRMPFGSVPAVIARDGCIALSGTCFEAHTAIGVGVRTRNEGSATTGYLLFVQPALRCFKLMRSVSSREVHHCEPLRDWEFSAAVRPLGAVNELELRCADSVLRVVVNGETVANVVDARFGFGTFRWLAETFDRRPADVVLHGLGLWRAR